MERAQQRNVDAATESSLFVQESIPNRAAEAPSVDAYRSLLSRQIAAPGLIVWAASDAGHFAPFPAVDFFLARRARAAIERILLLPAECPRMEREFS